MNREEVNHLSERVGRKLIPHRSILNFWKFSTKSETRKAKAYSVSK